MTTYRHRVAVDVGKTRDGSREHYVCVYVCVTLHCHCVGTAIVDASCCPVSGVPQALIVHRYELRCREVNTSLCHSLLLGTTIDERNTIARLISAYPAAGATGDYCCTFLLTLQQRERERDYTRAYDNILLHKRTLFYGHFSCSARRRAAHGIFLLLSTGTRWTKSAVAATHRTALTTRTRFFPVRARARGINPLDVSLRRENPSTRYRE